LLLSFLSSLLWFMVANRKGPSIIHYSVCINQLLALS
jgi:hypothetical protein